MKNTCYEWYDQLFNYVPEPNKTTVGEVKDQIMSPFKTKDCSKPERVKIMYVGGKKQLKENIIKSIRNLFKLEKENKGIKGRTILKQQNKIE